jgi:hypothetical protein
VSSLFVSPLPYDGFANVLSVKVMMRRIGHVDIAVAILTAALAIAVLANLQTQNSNALYSCLYKTLAVQGTLVPDTSPRSPLHPPGNIQNPP